MAEDPRVDEYVARAAAFAQPILRHFRDLVHGAAPAAAETIKWGMPFFEYRQRPIAMMAAFKAHAGIGIFDGSPMSGGEGMGQFGKLKDIGDLPDAAVIAGLIGQAMALVDAGGKPMRPAVKKPPLEVPADLRTALDAVPAAATAFAGFPPSAQREYVEWVLEARQATTRASRIATTVEWSAEGKRRYWKMARG